MPKSKRAKLPSKGRGPRKRKLTTTVVQGPPVHSYFKPLVVKPPPELSRSDAAAAASAPPPQGSAPHTPSADDLPIVVDTPEPKPKPTRDRRRSPRSLLAASSKRNLPPPPPPLPSSNSKPTLVVNCEDSRHSLLYSSSEDEPAPPPEDVVISDSDEPHEVDPSDCAPHRSLIGSPDKDASAQPPSEAAHADSAPPPEERHKPLSFRSHLASPTKPDLPPPPSEAVNVDSDSPPDAECDESRPRSCTLTLPAKPRSQSPPAEAADVECKKQPAMAPPKTPTPTKLRRSVRLQSSQSDAEQGATKPATGPHRSAEEGDTKPVRRSRLSRSRRAAPLPPPPSPPPQPEKQDENEGATEVVDLCLESPKRPQRSAPPTLAGESRKLRPKRPFFWTRAASSSSNVVEVDQEAPKLQPWWKRGVSHTKRRRTSSEDDEQPQVVDVDEPKEQPKDNGEENAEAVAPKPKLPLHSFFTKPIVSTRVLSECRITLCAPDPWTSEYAAVHVNVPKRLGPRQLLPCARHEPPSSDWSCLSELVALLKVNDVPSLHEYQGQSEDGKLSIWSDLYRKDKGLDEANTRQCAALHDWLRAWYRIKEDQAEREDDIRSEESWDDDEDEEYESLEELEDMEKIAIVTGPTGSGKTAIVRNVARRLGLAIVEINQSVCRSSKKVKDQVTDALKIHRVTNNRVDAFGTLDCTCEGAVPRSPRTLVVFEEVDMLHADELGFWKMLRDIALDGDCKRPIVCTASSITPAMQAVFGYGTSNDPRSDVFNVLTPEPMEDVPNTISFKRIALQRKTPREVFDALQLVASREQLNVDEDALKSFVFSMPRADVRGALNALQLRSIAPNGELLSHLTRCAQRAVDSLCEKRHPESALILAEQQLAVGDTRLLDGMYLATTELYVEGQTTTDGCSIGAIADALDGFSCADVLECGDRWAFDHAVEEECNILPGAHELHACNVSYSMATDVRASALATLAQRGLLADIHPMDLVHESQQRASTPLGCGVPLEGFRPLLNRRSAATEYVPTLRMMAVGAHEARKRACGKSSKAKGMVFSRVGLATRSRTRGNPMHLLGIGEPGYLESACLYNPVQLIEEDELE